MITKDQFTAIATTLVVWGLAGGLFGALFAGLSQVLSTSGLSGWLPPVLAAAAAAMITSAFYSAMPVALTGAMAGVLASIGALIALGQDLDLPLLAGAAALAGLAAGSFYAWMSEGTGHPLSRTLAGLAAGLVAGLLLVGLIAVTGRQAGTFVLAAGMVAVVGTLFQVSARWLGGHGDLPLPAGPSAALVAGTVAALVAAGIWTLGVTPLAGADGATSDLLGQLRREIPPGLLGGLAGGALTGLVLELLGFRLEDHV
jgi:hypothetical protein